MGYIFRVGENIFVHFLSCFMGCSFVGFSAYSSQMTSNGAVSIRVRGISVCCHGM